MLSCRDAVAGGGPQLNITTVDVSFSEIVMTLHVSGLSLPCCPSCCVMMHVHLQFSCLALVWVNPGLMCSDHCVPHSRLCHPCRSSHLQRAALCSTASCQGLHLRPAMCTSESLLVASQNFALSACSRSRQASSLGMLHHLPACPDAETPMAPLGLAPSLSHPLTMMPTWPSAGFLRTAQLCSLCVAQ